MMICQSQHNYPHMNVDVGDLGQTESALVILDPGVLLPIVLQHLRQAEELDAAIWNCFLIFLLASSSFDVYSGNLDLKGFFQVFKKIKGPGAKHRAASG